jgi:hypothetical protein
MKPTARNVLIIFGLITLLCGVVLFCIFIAPILVMFHGWNQQMTAGRKYMDSLTEKDFLVWTERTQKYLSEFDPKSGPIDAKAVPVELQKLKIVRIDEGSNYVGYVWMGGMDHTELLVEQMPNGKFQFTATYNDQSNRIIWPK